MLWRRGWLFNSLKYQIEKDIRSTLYKNETFLNNRYNKFERLIIWGSKNICLAILIIMIATGCFFWFFSMPFGVRVACKYLSGSSGDLRDIIGFMPNVFMAQVTLLALVFPITMAFISVLMQGKSSYEAILMVHNKLSGFLLVTYSSFWFSGLCIVCKLAEPWIIPEQGIALSYAMIFWFFLNLCLTARFLGITVLFLSSDRRMEIFAKYTINYVLAEDIRLRFLLHHNHFERTGNLISTATHEKVTILANPTGSLYVDTLTPQISHSFSKRKTVTNVWYNLLNMGIWFWKIPILFSRKKDIIPVFSFALNITGHGYKEILLVKGNSRINGLAGFFIKKAIRTSNVTTTNLNVKQMSSVLFAQIEDSLSNNNIRLFELAMDNLLYFQTEIINAMSFKNDQGEYDNWALLPDGNFFSSNFLDFLINETRSINSTIIRRIKDNNEYYHKWCRIYINLFDRQPNMPFQVISQYIKGHYRIWHELLNGLMTLDKNSTTEKQQRDYAIKYFIGTWESWSRCLSEDFNFANDRSLESVRYHLIQTSYMVIYAAKYENTEASKWAIDVLIRWYSNFNGHSSHFSSESEIVALPLLQNTKSPVLQFFRDANRNFHMAESAERSIALENLWTDVRYYTAACLLATKETHSGNQHKQYIETILRCTGFAASGYMSMANPPSFTSSELVGAYLRQRDCWEDNSSYRKILEEHIETLIHIESPSMISGRTYMSSGSNQEKYLIPFFKIIGIGVTKSSFKLDYCWSKLFSSKAVSYRHLEATIRELQKLIPINEDSSIIENVCQQFDIQEDIAKNQLALFAISINDIITKLGEINVTRVHSAPLDDQRLKAIGITTSSAISMIKEQPVPISLFQNIEYSYDYKNPLVELNLTGSRKSDVSQGLDVNRAMDESEFYTDFVKDQVEALIFQQLNNKLPLEESEFNNDLALITQAVEDSKLMLNAGLTPILIVGPWSLCRLINDSQREYATENEKLPFAISIKPSDEDNYVCHLEGMEVYRSPINKQSHGYKLNYSTLIPKEAFKTISIKDFGDGRYVDVTFATEKPTDLIGTLTFSFGIECEFETDQCFKYISTDTDEVSDSLLAIKDENVSEEISN